MIRSTRIRLVPTKEQEVLFWKSAGTARWAYNFALKESQMWYEDTGKTLSEMDIRKFINRVLKPRTHQWLKEVGSNVMKQAVKDFDRARKNFFQGLSSYPKLKRKDKSKPSFYVNYESLKKVQGGFRGEKIGFVKTANVLPKISKNEKYTNPRISFDGKNWFLSLGYSVEKEDAALNDFSLGIDVGVKELAVTSQGKVYQNINKTKPVKRLEKKLKREQRKLSRKMEANIKGYTSGRNPIFKEPFRMKKNFQKQKKLIQGLHKRFRDIRTNHLHQVSNEIVKTKPSRIVMESLNVTGMMKNKHLAKAVASQKLFELKRQIQYKSEKFSIEFIEADKWYPSSKTCSDCGEIKKDLKLKDRIYNCSCGLVLNRDLNAAINLSNYCI